MIRAFHTRGVPIPVLDQPHGFLTAIVIVEGYTTLGPRRGLNPRQVLLPVGIFKRQLNVGGLIYLGASTVPSDIYLGNHVWFFDTVSLAFHNCCLFLL